MDVPVADLIEELGHKGDQVIWPDLPVPQCYASWHIQEMVILAMKYNYNAIVIDKYRSYYRPGQDIVIKEIDIKPYLNHKRMVVLTDAHAYASDGIYIYDNKIQPINPELIRTVIDLI